MWKQIKSNPKTFQFGDEPELIHIIKSGYENLYIIVYDDAYQYFTGRTELCTKKDIKNKFSIDMDEIKMGEEFHESIRLLVNKYPNDQELGREVRKNI